MTAFSRLAARFSPPRRGTSPYRVPAWAQAIVLLLLITAAVLLWTAPQRRERSLRAAPLTRLQALAKERPNDARVHYHLGLRLSQTGQSGPAYEALSHAAELDPDDSAIWVATAGAAGAVNGRQATFNILDDFVKRHPEDAAARLAFAEAYRASRSYQRAYEEARVAVRLDPKNADAWRTLGRSAAVMKHNDEAEAALRKAVSLAPGDWRNQNSLADALSEWGRGAESIPFYREAARLAPDEAVPPLGLGRALLLTKPAPSPDQVREAREALIRSRGVRADIPMTHLFLGRCFALEGKWPEARGAFEEARRLVPGDPDAYYELARVYRRLGNDKAAVRALARHRDREMFKARKGVLEAKIAEAGGDAAKEAPYRLELARGLAARAMYREASAQYERLYLASPGRTDIRKEYEAARRRAQPTDALLREADALLAQHHPEAAASLYLTVTERDRKSAVAWEGAGVSLAAAGDVTRAVPCLLRAVELDPERPRAQMALAQVYHRAGLSQMARPPLEKVVKAEPNNAAAWHDLGIVLKEKTSTREQGLEALMRAVILEPKNSAYRLDLADAQAEANKVAEAEKTFRDALTLDAKSGDALSRFGGFLAQHAAGAPARQAEAERLLTEALAFDPQDDFARYQLGRIAYERGDYKQAVALLERVLADPKNAGAPDVWYALARACRRAGDAARAAKAEANADRIQKAFIAANATLERAAQRPSDPKAQLAVARVYATRGQYAHALLAYDRSLSLDPRNAATRSERDALQKRLTAAGKMPPMETYRALVAASASADGGKAAATTP